MIATQNHAALEVMTWEEKYTSLCESNFFLKKKQTCAILWLMLWKICPLPKGGCAGLAQTDATFEVNM